MSMQFGWYHFSPPGILIPLSLMYPGGQQEEDLHNLRDQSHKRFFLPDDRPIFRKSCALSNKADLGDDTRKKGSRLQNVHKFAKSSGNRHLGD